MGLDNARGVLMGACIITMVNAAGPRSFSIIYVELMDRYQASAAATAGIGSLLAGAQLFAGICVYDVYGCMSRPICVNTVPQVI